MIAIIGLITPFFALIALGLVCGRVFRHSVDGLAWLNVFVVYLALPALFFQLLSKTPVEKLASAGFITATTLGTFVIFVFGLTLALLGNRGDLRAATVQGLAGAYGNIGFMGPGLALAAFGPDAAVPVALIFCFDNTLHFVMAPLMMAVGSDRQRSLGRIVLSILRKILTHPFIVATIVGVVAAILHLTPPDPVDRFLELLAKAAAPCALFTMGVSIALRPLNRVPGELGLILPIKLLLHPLLIWGLLIALGPFDPVWVATAILLASLPTATNVFVIAQQYGVWTERASASVLMTTVASIVTVTLVLALLSSGLVDAHPLP